MRHDSPVNDTNNRIERHCCIVRQKYNREHDAPEPLAVRQFSPGDDDGTMAEAGFAPGQHQTRDNRAPQDRRRCAKPADQEEGYDRWWRRLRRRLSKISSG